MVLDAAGTGDDALRSAPDVSKILAYEAAGSPKLFSAEAPEGQVVELDIAGSAGHAYLVYATVSAPPPRGRPVTCMYIIYKHIYICIYTYI